MNKVIIDDQWTMDHGEPLVKERGWIRIALGTLLGFLALNAFGGGIYGILGAEGVPTEMLRGSPFASYLIPSIILCVVVGGSMLAASVLVFRRWRHAQWAVALSMGIVFVWLAVQVKIIGYTSWLQPAVAIAAIVVLLLNRFLPVEK
jgi:hypothetical protein